MNPEQLMAIERWNLLLSGAAILVALLCAPEAHALGVAVGAVLGCVNFTAIRRIWQAVARSDGPRRQGLQLILAGKMIALMVLVALAITFLPLAPAGLAVGLSIFLVSIAIESVRFALGRTHG